MARKKRDKLALFVGVCLACDFVVLVCTFAVCFIIKTLPSDAFYVFCGTVFGVETIITAVLKVKDGE